MRHKNNTTTRLNERKFPFLFGGTFIEAIFRAMLSVTGKGDFPSFSEGLSLRHTMSDLDALATEYFPSFSEGLSLRHIAGYARVSSAGISLPFRRDFH